MSLGLAMITLPGRLHAKVGIGSTTTSAALAPRAGLSSEVKVKPGDGVHITAHQHGFAAVADCMAVPGHGANAVGRFWKMGKRAAACVEQGGFSFLSARSAGLVMPLFSAMTDAGVLL